MQVSEIGISQGLRELTQRSGNLLHSRLRSRQPTKPADNGTDKDEEAAAPEFSSFPVRKPRVEEERYQAKLPKLMSKDRMAADARSKLTVVWNGKNSVIYGQSMMC